VRWGSMFRSPLRRRLCHRRGRATLPSSSARPRLGFMPPHAQAEPETIDPELAEDPADQPPTIPDQVRATVARVKGTPGATDYIAWLKDEGAPEHILNYARHELEEQQ